MSIAILLLVTFIATYLHQFWIWDYYNYGISVTDAQLFLRHCLRNSTDLSLYCNQRHSYAA